MQGGDIEEKIEKKMMTGYGMVQDQNLEKQIEKQMGCMAGFLQLFDRHQILTAKKIYSTKRLPPSKVYMFCLPNENL